MIEDASEWYSHDPTRGDMKINHVLARRVAINMRHMRERAGLSQRELSRRMEVSAPLVNLIEAGEREPSLEMVERIAIALKVLPASLFKEE